MSQYIPFTEEQKELAACVDLEAFLRYRGEKLIRSGRDMRLESDRSITIRGGEWYDHSVQRGGNAISFVQNFYGVSYPEAMKMLLGDELGVAFPAAKPKEPEPPKEFVLPEANPDMQRVYAYLMKERKIDRSVISHFARKDLIYEDAKYHNAVFVGADENGVPRHAHKRSTNSVGSSFRLNVEGSDPRYSFHHIGNDGSLFVFEAPIDMLSYITLYPNRWWDRSFVACCGTSVQPVMKMLELMPETDTVYLCLDNDEAGHKASARMAEQLEEKGVTAERLMPEMKDWNEDLVTMTRYVMENGTRQQINFGI